MPTDSVEFAWEVNPKTAVELDAMIEYTGKITEVVVHIPPGCAGLVHVQLWKNQKQLVPQKGYLAWDSATVSFPIKESVQPGDRLWVRFENHDTVNKHKPSVLVVIEYD